MYITDIATKILKINITFIGGRRQDIGIVMNRMARLIEKAITIRLIILAIAKGLISAVDVL